MAVMRFFDKLRKSYSKCPRCYDGLMVNYIAKNGDKILICDNGDCQYEAETITNGSGFTPKAVE